MQKVEEAGVEALTEEEQRRLIRQSRRALIKRQDAEKAKK